MTWNLEGKTVKAKYLGEYVFTGIVINSRVKYGGTIQHDVELDVPLEKFGYDRISLLVNSDNILEVFE